jgi:hypothetical protein
MPVIPIEVRVELLVAYTDKTWDTVSLVIKVHEDQPDDDDRLLVWEENMRQHVEVDLLPLIDREVALTAIYHYEVLL